MSQGIGPIRSTAPRRSRVPAPLVLWPLVLLAATVGLGAALWGEADEWERLVALGDRLAAAQSTAVLGGHPVTARAAYLLAFHHAQDREDAGRMLLAGDRLERLGERTLAAHVRQAVRALPPAATPAVRTSGGSGSPGAGSRGAPWP
jgi:hypothetical protein